MVLWLGEANKISWEFGLWETGAPCWKVSIPCVLHNGSRNINYPPFCASVEGRTAACQTSPLQNTFTTRSKFSCTCWCTLGREPREHPPAHGPEARHLRAARRSSGNTPQQLLLGTSSEILSEVVSGNAVVSVNSVNGTLLFPKPQETVPFSGLELKLAQLLCVKITFLRMGAFWLIVFKAQQVFNYDEGSLYQEPCNQKK